MSSHEIVNTGVPTGVLFHKHTTREMSLMGIGGGANRDINSYWLSLESWCQPQITHKHPWIHPVLLSMGISWEKKKEQIFHCDITLQLIFILTLVLPPPPAPPQYLAPPLASRYTINYCTSVLLQCMVD